MPVVAERLGVELNVSQLLMEPSGSSREYELDEESFELVESFGKNRIHGAVNLLRTNKSIWVSAGLHSTLDSECGRCLTPYSHPIFLQVEEEYIPTLNPLTGARVTPPSDDSDYYLIDENHTLDLTEVAREYAIMALPMKPLCSQECSGLCSTCGSNLNHTRCACEAPVDPRWGPLLELMSGATETN